MKSTNAATAAKTPTHIAYQVRAIEGRKGFWTRIGSAWAHKDGKGFSIQIESTPLDGKITLRIPFPKR